MVSGFDLSHVQDWLVISGRGRSLEEQQFHPANGVLPTEATEGSTGRLLRAWLSEKSQREVLTLESGGPPDPAAQCR
jgi:hypothetical protein